MTKKEATKPAPLLCMFERILDKFGLFMDSKDWRELNYSFHVDWVKPLLEVGAIKEVGHHPAWPDGANMGGRSQFNYYNFVVTPEGISWWAKERTRDHENEHGEIRIERLSQPCGERSPYFDGKGIGSPVTIWWCEDIAAAVKGIREGYLNLDGHDNGHPAFWRMHETITVSLTAAGMRYFDSLPRLMLECA